MNVGVGSLEVYTALSIAEYGIRAVFALTTNRPIAGLAIEVPYRCARSMTKKREENSTKGNGSTPSQQSLYNDDFFL